MALHPLTPIPRRVPGRPKLRGVGVHEQVTGLPFALQQRLFTDWSMALARIDVIDPKQQAFCKALRDLELSTTKEHLEFVTPFFESFRAWLR